MTPRFHVSGMGDIASKYATLGIAGLGDSCYPSTFIGPLPAGASYCPAGVQTTTLSGPVCMDSTASVVDCSDPSVAYQYNLPSTAATTPAGIATQWIPGIANTTLILGVSAVFALMLLMPGGRR